MKPNILAVSDISLGYGSPQILWFLQSLAQKYDTSAHVIETDEQHRPLISLADYERLNVVRLSSAQVSWCLSSHLERNHAARLWADENRPEIVVIFSPLQLALLNQIKYKPKLVILYLLEIELNINSHMLQCYWHCIDRLIVPELNRGMAVLETIKDKTYPPTSIIYNVARRDLSISPLPANNRNGRILYSGSLSSQYTFAEDFTKELKDFPIDIYGPINEAEQDELGPAFEGIRNARQGANYKGYVAGSELRRLLPSYTYSIVRWNPKKGLNYYYACPNKFFEGLAHGVPPISAPHPQCMHLTRQYECGLVAEDFSVEAMAKAIQHGIDLLNTSSYDRMVQNCLEAYDRFFNWDAQFARFAESLPAKESLL